MAAFDFSGIAYFLPLFSFLLVFVVTYSVLNKTKIVGEDKWIQLLISFIISTVFVIAVRPREYILDIVPWFAVLVITLFFVLAMTGFVGGLESFGKGIGRALVWIMLALFLLSAYFVFSDILNESGIADWIFSAKVIGAIVLLGISALVAWVLVKAK